MITDLPPGSERLIMTDREQHSETIIQDYLDDRLSAVDRQQVEEQLVTDPQAQQELEELRMIGSALRELPAHQLGDDFVDEVMVGGEVGQRFAHETTDGFKVILFHERVQAINETLHHGMTVQHGPGAHLNCGCSQKQMFDGVLCLHDTADA